jgi:hypothetical protein
MSLREGNTLSARAAWESARNTLRNYMRLAPDDNVDLAVFAAIISNFAPDRVNPLWFVLIGASEAGKSLLLDAILGGWQPVEKMPNRIAKAYFFSARTGSGALKRIQEQRKRILYMRDMGSLLALPMDAKAEIHNQILGVYDGDYRHETGMTSTAQVYTAEPSERLGWIGAATEAFYDRFLVRTYAAGARFTAWYWPDERQHWTDYGHLQMQRSLRSQRLAPRATQEALQTFLNESIVRLNGKGWNRLELSAELGRRIDAATTFVMRIMGGISGANKSTPRGGRTADRAAQFARAAAHVTGAGEIEPEHANLAVRLIFSQLPVVYQEVLGYAVREENWSGWRFRDFLAEIGGSRQAYLRRQDGGPIDVLLDVGILREVTPAKKAYGGPKTAFALTDASWKLISAFDAKCAELKRPAMDPITTQASSQAQPEMPSVDTVEDDETARAIADARRLVGV